MEILFLIFEVLGQLIGLIVGIADFMFFIDFLIWISKCFERPINLEKEFNPILSAFGAFIFGGSIGALSLLLPKFFVLPQLFRLINLILSPLICGIIMHYYRKYRDSKNLKSISLISFSNAFLFVFAMALVRYFFR